MIKLITKYRWVLLAVLGLPLPTVMAALSFRATLVEALPLPPGPLDRHLPVSARVATPARD